MAKPIYAGSYSSRGSGKWKRVFVIIILVQIALVGIYLFMKKGDREETAEEKSSQTSAPEPTDA